MHKARPHPSLGCETPGPRPPPSLAAHVDELHRRIARRIRERTRERGIVLSNLADFAGVSRAQLFRVLAGQSSPTVARLAQIAKALDVEPSDLIAKRTRR